MQIVIQMQQHQNHQLTQKFNCSEMIHCFRYCNNGTVPFFPPQLRNNLTNALEVGCWVNGIISTITLPYVTGCQLLWINTGLRAENIFAVSVHRETEWGTAHARNKWPQRWSRPGRADDKLRLQCDSSSPSMMLFCKQPPSTREALLWSVGCVTLLLSVWYTHITLGLLRRDLLADLPYHPWRHSL